MHARPRQTDGPTDRETGRRTDKHHGNSATIRSNASRANSIYLRIAHKQQEKRVGWPYSKKVDLITPKKLRTKSTYVSIRIICLCVFNEWMNEWMTRLPLIKGRPPANVFIYALLTFLLRWPWPWSDDRDIRTCPRYSEDGLAYQKWFLDQGRLSKVWARTKRTDKQTLPNALPCCICEW